MIQFVTIKKLSPLFKGDVLTKLSLAEFNEIGNTLVVLSTAYQVGDSALFIEPDVNLMENNLFLDYIAPNGNKSKTRLGKNNRVRAIRFNLATKEVSPIYSNGLLITIPELKSIFGENFDLNSITPEMIGVYKVKEEEETETLKGIKGDPKASSVFPSGIYKSDETNFNLIKDKIEYPVELYLSRKVDGSSITIYYKNENEYGICSRNQEKKLCYQKIVGVAKLSVFDRIANWFLPKNNKIVKYIYEETPSESEFVKHGMKYLERLITYCKTYKLSLALRGELCGKGLRGSGNTNNPDIKSEPHVKFYGLDELSTGIAQKCTVSNFIEVVELGLGFHICDSYTLRTFESEEDLISQLETLIKFEKETNNRMIEGIVCKTPDSRFSFKYINLEYDARK